jgi:hypothetical protein
VRVVAAFATFWDGLRGRLSELLRKDLEGVELAVEVYGSVEGEC